MKILLIGYGKMGKAIEAEAINLGHVIAGKVDTYEELASFNISSADVAIEFTQPDSAFRNLKYCAENKLPVVCGTTGWLDHMDELKRIVNNNSSAFFYASNFSIGVNITFHVNKVLAKIMSNQNQYDVEIKEVHHTEKKDAPSGTAITLAEGVLRNHDSYSSWKLDGTDDEMSIPIKADRIPDVPGTHTIKYKSDIDEISLEHKAYSRKGFAQGAVYAAAWLSDKRGNFGMEDMLKF